MGFTPPRSVYNLVFDDPDFEGLHIRVHAASMEDRMRAVYDLSWQDGDSVEVRKRKQADLFQLFVDHVIEWNLEDSNREPVPVTVAGLLRVCEPEQAGAILGAWQRGRQSVPAPLEQPSPATALSEIPMTVLLSTPEPVSSSAC